MEVINSRALQVWRTLKLSNGLRRMSSEERREARRKRILQNSENRLKKITGELASVSQAMTAPLDSLEFLKEEKAASPTIQHGGVLDEDMTLDLPDNIFESFPPQDSETEDKTLEENALIQTSEKKTTVEKHVRLDDLLIFSLLALVVFTLEFYEFNIFGENLFSPFSLVEVTRFFRSSAFKMEKLTNLGILESAISLSGMNNTKAMALVRGIIYVFRVLKSVWVDLSYYLATYIIIVAIFQGF
ncbi:uncharacterized protein LOC136032274 isoform X2 [Artemia franciscana]|uniref:uncharacterized protein LOC136032274 isoform X2 n=1 Tax=Artemia franciscana TaxID=6661 RepID=UPI0032DB1F31